ncbi:hypothetical protein HD599_003238 [Conyzicola lurida]|uniref:Uncharacterized protein n=1 Tax=Conyzicola lurida TaxID=1172621 RepID=A0A841ATJ8_9MICO|nr:hypothetical protein [Conyzicola lurida]MBB5844915.1 hypothetical protein [Conyzicola lurida]
MTPAHDAANAVNAAAEPYPAPAIHDASLSVVVPEALTTALRSYAAQAKGITTTLAAVTDYNQIRQLVTAATEAQRQQERLIASTLTPAFEAVSRYHDDIAKTVTAASRFYQAEVASTYANVARIQDAAAMAVANVTRYEAQFGAIAALATKQQSMYATSFDPVIDAFNRYQAIPTMTALQTRYAVLEQGFRAESGTPADDFGRVLKAADRHPSLRASLDAAIVATQKPGTFGADFVGFRTRTADVADAFDDAENDPSLMEPLEALQESAQLTDEVLFDLGDALGLWERVKTHRLSAARLVICYTIGLTGFVAYSGTGAPWPVALFDSVIAGGGMYLALSDRAREN